ncbi:MAG: hypothetical protein RXQ71_04880 [Caldisphaera sp.]
MRESGGNNKENVGKEKENRDIENGVGGSFEGYKSDGDYKEYNNRLYDDSCKELLRKLAEISSEESSLVFRIYKLREEAKYMALELSGLLSQYKLLGGDYKEFQKFFEDMFEKYVENASF